MNDPSARTQTCYFLWAKGHTKCCVLRSYTKYRVLKFRVKKRGREPPRNFTRLQMNQNQTKANIVIYMCGRQPPAASQPPRSPPMGWVSRQPAPPHGLDLSRVFNGRGRDDHETIRFISLHALVVVANSGGGTQPMGGGQAGS